MSPGQAALVEAMRLEQARIYSRTVPEHRQHDQRADRDGEIAYWNQRGQSPTSIAFRLGVSKRDVRAALDRLGAA